MEVTPAHCADKLTPRATCSSSKTDSFSPGAALDLLLTGVFRGRMFVQKRLFFPSRCRTAHSVLGHNSTRLVNLDLKIARDSLVISSFDTSNSLGVGWARMDGFIANPRWRR